MIWCRAHGRPAISCPRGYGEQAATGRVVCKGKPSSSSFRPCGCMCRFGPPPLEAPPQRRSRKEPPMPTKRDTYQIITDTILGALENCGPCERPWGGPSLTMPVNAVSGHEYRGTNVVMLWIAAREAGYLQNAWATFKQWSEKGATVRKGEKGTPSSGSRCSSARRPTTPAPTGRAAAFPAPASAGCSMPLR